MKMQKIKFLCTALLCINLIQSPIKAEIINGNTTTPDKIAPTIGIAAALYVGYNYLSREEFLVKNTHPHAQAWYNSLIKKYPDAHLDTRKFIQTPSGNFLSIPKFLSDFANQCSWISAYDHIYFSSDSLKEIDYLYKKFMQGYPLDKDEQLALARQEFILLYETGHIK
ncbi:MAG: hypothetical protein JO129_00030, partial [Candidatus Dependentiae bacterium]|nr:hypothetical protein [Candidatus Dependentiae bacterium]